MKHMSAVLAALGSGLLLTASLSTTAGADAPRADLPRAAGKSIVAQAKALGFDRDKQAAAPRPKGANPYLALLRRPGRVDYAAWDAYLDRVGDRRDARRERVAARTGSQQRLRPPVAVEEQEPDGSRGSNDTYQTAQPIPQLGTSRNPRARISGSLDNEPVAVEARPRSTEDDGSITLARTTGVGTVRDGFSTRGRIGDGPYGSRGTGSGDFDVYAVRGIAGKSLTVETDSPRSDLDSMVSVLDADGNVVAFNDDFEEIAGDSKVSWIVPENGTYYVFVHGFANFPEDPFDSSSGDDAGSEGSYRVTITQGDVDVDVYGVRLAVGDVLGLSLTGGATVLGILEPDGGLVHGSNQDASFIYPINTPLPGGGNAVNDHVADEAGWHYVAVEAGSGSYDVTAEVYRPGPEGNPPKQTIYLDFDGARVNTAIWAGPGVRDLSPLRSFLGRWGLTNADYAPLVRQIVQTARENLIADMNRSGISPDFQVAVRSGKDTFGQPNVSRLIVGGTIQESGIDTIGIAQSIDPGNFGTEESALILLDVLSGSPDEFGDASLNYYLKPRSDKVKFIGTAIGNVASHEAGHYLGNWHVDQFNDTLNVMDQGGNFPLLYGVGPDMVGGTADDPDVDFGEDTFNPNEGFLGVEDTLSRIAAVLVP